MPTKQQETANEIDRQLSNLAGRAECDGIEEGAAAIERARNWVRGYMSAEQRKATPF